MPDPTPHFRDAAEVERIANGEHGDPFSVLGAHACPESGEWIVRAMRPGAEQLWILLDDGREIECAKRHPAGVFEGRLGSPADGAPPVYRLRWVDPTGTAHGPVEDAFRFPPMLGEMDMYFLAEGSHRRLWKKLGARPAEFDGVTGVCFAVWAPNARRVSVTGDFNQWDGRVHPMRKRVETGVWEIFVPHAAPGDHYQFELIGGDGRLFKKSDPLAFFSQHGTSTASIVHDLNRYEWGDADWMTSRAERDLYQGPVSIYEVHLGSWARVPEEGDRFLSYRELGDRLLDYVAEMGFTHIELMPVTEFPFDGSWGYQVCGYFSPTSRFGSPDEFREFVDRAHQRGIGIILDWVPAHFPKDDHGLARFDGTSLYEHDDPRQGEHMDWGTLIFNFGRNEVRNFLIANALFWLEEYHIDGLRVDAVASMLYLDYSREEGQWVPNRHGGRENLEAIGFLRELNSVCYAEHPGIVMAAEESTAFPGVSKPVDTGGLGFGFKWNMGWMHDFLQYMSRDPVHRRFHHGEATFAMIYAYHENYILVLSHDEVVHGKKSLLEKMPGDRWQQFANLRLFLAWMFAHPGKKLLFQGCEIAQSAEWNFDGSIDWHLLGHREHAGVRTLVQDLNRLYRSEPGLNELDHRPEGFEWIDHLDNENSTFAFVRRGRRGEDLLVIVNATPVPRRDYRVGVSQAGFYEEILNTDSDRYGGSNVGSLGGAPSEGISSHGRDQSIQVQLPPLATVIFRRASS